MPLPPTPSRPPFIHSMRKPRASGTWAPASTLQLTLRDLSEPHSHCPPGAGVEMGPGRVFCHWVLTGLQAGLDC